MRRPSLHCFPAVFAILLSALPACDIDLGGPDGDHPPDLCGPPPADACRPDECETRGGCVLYDCDPATGNTVHVFCESPPAAIDGRWSLRTILDGEDPCPEVTRVDELELSVVPAPDFSTAAILDLEGHLLDTALVSSQFGQTGVRFTLHPTWTGPDGAEVPVHIEYDATVYSSSDISGRAIATATSGDATCTYQLGIDGIRD